MYGFIKVSWNEEPAGLVGLKTYSRVFRSSRTDKGVHKYNNRTPYHIMGIEIEGLFSVLLIDPSRLQDLSLPHVSREA